MTKAPKARKRTIHQVLPSARLIPHFKLDAAAKQEIEKVIARARGNPDEEMISLPNMFTVRVETCVSRYLSEKAFELPLPELRKQLVTVQRKVSDLVKILPADANADPFRHLRSLYCFGDPDPERTHHSHAEEREAEWDRWVGPESVRGVLGTWLELIEKVPLPKTKAADVARQRLVESLAAEWKKIGLWPGNSRKPGGQTGYFAEMVEIVAKRIPTPWQPSKLDYFIRLVAEMQKSAPPPEKSSRK